MFEKKMFQIDGYFYGLFSEHYIIYHCYCYYHTYYLFIYQYLIAT